ncbi:MAG: ABC transporter permease [Thermoplasmata archaeon]|nr:ABC transporter permease [Thermoplasmata archaeon]HHH78384.1 ABC transporter permease [Thermoplasmatales archaeon]
MNHLLNIIRKEVRELLTPATFVPIIVMAIIFGSMGNMIGGAAEEAKEKPVMGIINMDNGTFSSIVNTTVYNMSKVAYAGTSGNVDEGIEEGVGVLKEKGGTALIVVPSNFSERIENNLPGKIEVYWIMKGAGIMDSISSGVVEAILQEANRRISMELMEKGNVNATFALSPTARNETTIFKGKEMQGISPGTISAMLSSQSTMVPIIIMIIIMMAGGMVISSMGMEKENKTLETLLTLPVKRSSIVAGKIAGSAIVGLVMAAIYMVGFRYYLSSFQFSGNVNLADYGLVLDSWDYLLVGTSLFLALTAALSLCMVLGTFAKNYKSAQTLTVPVSVLALIPMIMIMFKDFDTLPPVLRAILFAIPFSHPMMAVRALLFGDYMLVISGIAYVSVFALAMIAIAVRIFKTDRLLTGSVNRSLFKRR